MHMTRFTIITFASLALALAPACNKAPAEAEAETAVNAEAALDAESDLGSDALVEEHEGGTVAWRVGADGRVNAMVATSAGARIKEDIGGTLSWKIPSGEVQTIPLALDAKTGLLVAAGPKLEADLNEVSYTLTVSGKPWSGVLHLPAGGTAELAASAKASVDVVLPEGELGPHGGAIQVVGEDRIELVAEEGSDEVRVYVLDADLRILPPESRTLKLGFYAERPDVVVLAPATDGLYFVGKLAAAVDPLRITVALGFRGATHVALWGYRPGAHLLVTAAAPRVKIHVKGAYRVPDVDLRARADVDVKVHGNGHGVKMHDLDNGYGLHGNAGVKAKAHGPDVKVHVNAHGPDVKVHGASVSAHGPSVGVKAKASAPSAKGKVEAKGKSGGKHR